MGGKLASPSHSSETFGPCSSTPVARSTPQFYTKNSTSKIPLDGQTDVVGVDPWECVDGVTLPGDRLRKVLATVLLFSGPIFELVLGTDSDLEFHNVMWP